MKMIHVKYSAIAIIPLLIIIITMLVVPIVYDHIVFHINLKPKVLFTKPRDNCREIIFYRNKAIDQKSLKSYFKSYHTNIDVKDDDFVFAIQGETVKGFIPDTEYGSKGTVEYENADPDTVYFYKTKVKFTQYFFP